MIKFYNLRLPSFSNALYFGKVLSFFLFLNLNAQSYFDTTTRYLTVRKFGNVNPMYDHKDYRLILDSVRVDTEFYSMRQIINGVKVVTNHLKVSKKKVYIQCENNGVKKFVLLYDFNLKDGESTLVNGLGLDKLYESSLLEIDSVRPIKLNGVTFSCHYSKVQGLGRLLLIEHIGSIENGILFFDVWGFESQSSLISLCRRDSLLLYKDHEVVKSGKNTCNPVFFGSGINDANTENSFIIYPNPGAESIRIAGNIDEPIDYYIYDLRGSLVSQGAYNASGTIDVSGLGAGLYTILISSREGMVKKLLTLEK